MSSTARIQLLQRMSRPTATSRLAVLNRHLSSSAQMAAPREVRIYVQVVQLVVSIPQSAKLIICRNSCFSSLSKTLGYTSSIDLPSWIPSTLRWSILSQIKSRCVFFSTRIQLRFINVFQRIFNRIRLGGNLILVKSSSELAIVGHFAPVET